MKKIYLIITTALLSISLIQAQGVEWVKQGSGHLTDRGNAICRDDAGNLYITGEMRDSIRFNNTLLQSDDSYAKYIVKYDTLGNVVWAKNSSFNPGPYNLGGGGITSDGANNIYAWGNGGYSVQKLDLNGNLVWNKDLFDIFPGSIGISDIKVVGNHLYIIGHFTFGNLFYNSGADSLVNEGGTDIFIVKTDLNLTIEWTTSEGGTGNDKGWGIYANSSDEIVAVGFFSDTVHFGTHQLVSNGNADIFMVKYDNTGSVVWANGYGSSTGLDLAAKIIADNSGNLYITGRFANAINFTGTAITGAGSSDAYIAKFDNAGTPVWATAIIGTGADEEADINIKDNKLVFISTTVGNVTAGTQTANGVGSLDICVGEADLNGNIAWIKLMGSNGMDEGSGICQVENSIYFVGSFNSTATFESHSLTSMAQWDVVTGKIGYSLTTKITDVTATNNMAVYPNPANNLLYVDYKGFADITITDFAGHIIVETNNCPPLHDTPVDISGLAKGMYIITIQNSSNKFVSRFVKQ